MKSDDSDLRQKNIMEICSANILGYSFHEAFLLAFIIKQRCHMPQDHRKKEGFHAGWSIRGRSNFPSRLGHPFFLKKNFEHMKSITA